MDPIAAIGPVIFSGPNIRLLSFYNTGVACGTRPIRFHTAGISGVLFRGEMKRMRR